MNKKTTSGVSLGGLILIVVIIIWTMFLKPTNQDTKQNQNNSQNNQVEVVSEKKVQTTEAKLKIEDVDLANLPRFQKISVADIRSVDGDTFAFRSRGTNFKLRLLMVDTPESVKEGMAVQPYGKEASNFTKEQLAKGDVSLVFDKGAVKDKYDRYLAYVYVGDKMLQNELLENGLGIVRYVDSGGDSYLQELLKAQKVAEDQKLGVWSMTNYVYKTKTSYYRYNEK